MDRYYGIFVREAELVDETFEQDEQEIFKIRAMVKDSNLDFWRDLVHNPKHWQDYSIPKFHGKHKTTSHPLWVIIAPQWVLPQLRELVSKHLNRLKEPKLLKNQTKAQEDMN
ncbi:hypothetical protein ACFE04_016954 [Oxalis oulophora]